MEHRTGLDIGSRIDLDCRSALDLLLQEGARQMLQKAVECEVSDYIEGHTHILDEKGHRQVVRNGHLPTRELHSGAGAIPVTQPRVRDKRPGKSFTSAILPPYLRRAPSIEALIPLLYLKGVSTNDMGDALASLLGDQARGLSASTITRLKEAWQGEYEEWTQRDLTAKRYVYFWADGIYFNVRLTPDRPCLLVVMGALADGGNSGSSLKNLWPSMMVSAKASSPGASCCAA